MTFPDSLTLIVTLQVIQTYLIFKTEENVGQNALLVRYNVEVEGSLVAGSVQFCYD